MKIIEDKDDRERMFKRLASEAVPIRAKVYEPSPRGGWARQHQLTPCVRLGAGEVYLLTKGWKPRSSRRRALHFARGHSHEAIFSDGNPLTIVYKGVACNVDEWTGEPDHPFVEIKSTMASSARMWEIVERGEVDIVHDDKTQFLSWFRQCLNYCVAVRSHGSRLRVFFMKGEYAERRKACPSCGGALGGITEDTYKPCLSCGYKSYLIDLRSYILTFSQEERTWAWKEVFQRRRDQFYLAVKAESVNELLMRADPTQCYVCPSCDVGQELGCERYGS